MSTPNPKASKRPVSATATTLTVTGEESRPLTIDDERLDVLRPNPLLAETYVSRKMANGDTDVEYLMGSRYRPGAGTGFRWNDPSFQIEWPIEPVVISDRDRTYDDFDQSAWSALRR